eukprot:3301530-Rhodomonas_salina.2
MQLRGKPTGGCATAKAGTKPPFVLRTCYAMSSTVNRNSASVLRARYARSSTDTASFALCPMRCPVLTEAWTISS